MARPSNSDRHTPRLAAFLDRLHHATDGTGIKSQVAEHLAADGRLSLASARAILSRILAGSRQPNAEDLLAILEILPTLERKKKRSRK